MNEQQAATLIMESHGLAHEIRSIRFSSFRTWSKLFQVGPYFLDVNLQPGKDTLELRGEIMSLDGEDLLLGGTVTLHEEGDSQPLDTTPLDSDVDFKFAIHHTGSYQLTMELNGNRFIVPRIKVR